MCPSIHFHSFPLLVEPLGLVQCSELLCQTTWRHRLLKENADRTYLTLSLLLSEHNTEDRSTPAIQKNYLQNPKMFKSNFAKISCQWPSIYLTNLWKTLTWIDQRLTKATHCLYSVLLFGLGGRPVQIEPTFLKAYHLWVQCGASVETKRHLINIWCWEKERVGSSYTIELNTWWYLRIS